MCAYRCARCRGTALPIDRRPQSEVPVRPDKLDVVASYCYLADMLSPGGGCVLVVTTRVKNYLEEVQGATCQFSHATTSLTRPMTMCTALASEASCSIPVKH